LALAGAAIFEVLSKVTRKAAPLSRTGVAFFSEDRRFSWAKAEYELHYTPHFDLREGIEATIAWYQQHGYLSSK
jgi:nucleoside-diphosphate-sugar epimerase